jgi:hypothetical protein
MGGVGAVVVMPVGDIRTTLRISRPTLYRYLALQ